MNFGLFSINAYASVEPRTLARVARAAEAAGFESLWAGEHVVLPDPQVPPSPMAPTDADPRPRDRADLRGGGDDARTARHRHHHPARSATRSCSPRSWRVSTCCRAAG